ncbi:Mak10 subunit, NatC N-terminal acetyltransferase-domain-containing protein [Pseudomassariella vexata]|uniref:Mak10 subunit, NatC N-terminal acetyltransferase-domain-containing protein n=1 Tax=Pseudomassariella vexata TaxID=1141098 RepID=A0A1Y2DXJ6_9PEZI|nr:Mak10 subunit, NatC N-terminal acetyltransferase-domain-containing protein [Pseudomassariella vexata]ORY63957.1 Mak10 subunit, NatC N-terminal acetyltransferase-domain-containing protein [Pseudomassariella vexata]
MEQHAPQSLPPRPNPSHPGVMAVDITDNFWAAVKTLAPGELVKDGHFTLFESVGALEIMDPKMDSGCLAEGESLDEEYSVTRDLLPEEVLGIMDQLLCLEMAWHQGYPLSQTLLTSVYVEVLTKTHPTTIEEVTFTGSSETEKNLPTLLFALKAYCIGLLKGCDFVNELVKDELYYEEEDFVTNSFGRNILLYDVELRPVNDMLQKARAELRVMNNKPSKDIAMALDIRLELRIAFLRAMELSALRTANPESLKMPWIQMHGLIEHIKKQHSLGKPVPDAFSTKLQRRLASTLPPRPIVYLSFEETHEHFRRLFKDGKEIMDVLKYSDPQSLLTFVSTFQARKPQPLPCIRTLLQNLMFKDNVFLGSYTIRQLIDHDLSIVSLPCATQLDLANDTIEVPTDPRHRTSNEMTIFRQRVEECYLDVFRIFCQNRCRVRRTLCHNIQAWDALQADVEEIDTRLQELLAEKPLQTESGSVGYSLPLSSWAYLYKLRQMEWIVQLGFELSVYQTDELAGMYWYVNYLAKTRAQHGDRIKTFVMRSLTASRASNSYTAAKDREYMRTLSYIRATMLDAACTWEFADGLCCLYTVLNRLGLIKSPPRPYSNDALRYEIRMKPFMTIGLPQLPTFDEFTKATAQPETAVDALLTYAESAVGGAKKGYEALSKMTDGQTFSVGCHGRWLANVKDCLKAAISAGIAVTTLQKTIAKVGDGGELKLKVEMPEAGKGYHDWWIVPKIVPTG